MHRLSFFVSVVALTACAGKPPASAGDVPVAAGGAAAPGLAAWPGVYEGDWVDEAPNAGGLTTPAVGYKLVVKPAGGRFEVQVEADGYQTHVRMAGEGVPSTDGRDLVVRFAACGEGDFNECRDYAKGDEIASLRREGGSVWLRFGKLSAPDDKLREIKVARSKG